MVRSNISSAIVTVALRFDPLAQWTSTLPAAVDSGTPAGTPVDSVSDFDTSVGSTADISAGLSALRTNAAASWKTLAMPLSAPKSATSSLWYMKVPRASWKQGTSSATFTMWVIPTSWSFARFSASRPAPSHSWPSSTSEAQIEPFAIIRRFANAAAKSAAPPPPPLPMSKLPIGSVLASASASVAVASPTADAERGSTSGLAPWAPWSWSSSDCPE
mmetsp:Transcript_83396/g.235063  ORF Transcript_83396/g.235063 Transcript_83396/m.235063 type:complete len:217 (-) Transcript_83396:734-1384(-)